MYYRLSILLSLLLTGSVSLAVKAQTLDQFETQLDTTIRSACHGYMIDTLPDFLSEFKSWLNTSTPFCQTIRTVPDTASVIPLFEQKRKQQSSEPSPAFNSKVARYYGRNNVSYMECNDWMCHHIREQVQHHGHPISQTDYQRVDSYCEGRYECIENWFKTWPRPLPEHETQTTTLSLDEMLATQTAPQPAPRSSGLTLDNMLGKQSQSTISVNKDNAISPTDQRLSIQSLDDANQHQENSANAGETSLDNIFSGRERIALEKSLVKIGHLHQRLQRQCQCSVLSEGCYQLPAETLVNSAQDIENQRYSLCSQWAGLENYQPETSRQAESIHSELANLETNVKALDAEMDQQIKNWHQQQQRLIAQQQQQQEDRENMAYFGGLASVLLQSGAAASGLISAEQAAQNSVNVYNSISSGDSVASAFASSATAISSSAAASSNRSNTVSSQSNANTTFACQKTGDHVCREYTVDGNKATQFKQQCRDSGFSILPSCDHSQPSCRYSTSGSTQVTYFNHPTASEIPVLRDNCIAGSGQFSQ